MIPLIIIPSITGDAREWYEDSTISVSKTGVTHTITSVGSGSTETSTIIVTPAGVKDTTSDV